MYEPSESALSSTEPFKVNSSHISDTVEIYEVREEFMNIAGANSVDITSNNYYNKYILF